jgi:excisionase family DNA binding protein
MTTDSPRLGPSAPLLTSDEAARLLRVPRSTLYELVRSRGLPHVRRADLEEWIAQNTYGTRRNR